MKTGLGPNDFETPSIEKINKVFQVLKSMCNNPIDLGGYKYKLAETLDGGFALVYPAEVSNGNSNETQERWFGMDMSLRTFTELCNKISDDDFTFMAANNALNEIQKQQRKDRNL